MENTAEELRLLSGELLASWERFTALLGNPEGRRLIGTAEAVEALIARSSLQRVLETGEEVDAARLLAADEAYRRVAPTLLESTRVELYASDKRITDWWWQVHDLAGAPITESLLDVPSAAKHKGVHPHTVRAAIHAGDLPSRRLGRGFLIHQRDLERWTPRRAGRPAQRPSTETADELLAAFNKANLAEDWEKAHVLADLLAKRPTSPRRCLAVAIDSFNSARYEDAVKWVERARSGGLSDEGITTAVVTSALASVELGRPREAIQALVDHEPAPSLRWRSRAALAEALLANHQPARAHEVVRGAIAERPEAYELRYLAARVAFHADRIVDAHSEIVLFRAADPTNGLGIMMHGSILGRLGDTLGDRTLYEQAVELFSQAMQSEGFRAQAKLAIASARLGRWRFALQQARSLWSSGNERPANTVVAAALAAASVAGAHQVREAVDMAERWVTTTPMTRAHRAFACLQLGDSKEAWRIMESDLPPARNLPAETKALVAAVLAGLNRTRDASPILDELDQKATWSTFARLLRLRLALGDRDQKAADRVLFGLAEDDGEMGVLASLCRELMAVRDNTHSHQKASAFLAFAMADERVGAIERDAKTWDIGHRRVSKIVGRTVATLPS